MMTDINDTRILYAGQLPEGTYHKYCKNRYSQNGEDGILEKLLSELNIQSGYCCEFGAHDGISSSNTYALVKDKRFKGLCIEADSGRFRQLVNNYQQLDNVLCVQEYVTSKNLGLFLEKANFPRDFDVLSIDIDSYDYQIWKDFTTFRPKIVIIETNSYRDPGVEELHGEPTKDYVTQFDPLRYICESRIAVGTSFFSILKLGLSKNYIPVSFTGNITFVAREHIEKLKEFPYKLSEDPYDYIDLYTNLVLWEDNKWYTNTGLMFNVAVGKFVRKNRTLNYSFNTIVEEMNQKGHMIWDSSSL
jgi:hypothetical protein